MSITETLPVHPNVLAMYIAQLDEEGLAPASVRSAISAIGWYHRINSLPDPTGGLALRRLLLGLKKTGPPPRQVKALQKDLLFTICSLLTAYPLEEYLLRALKAIFLLAYHACLRIGEVVESGSAAHTLLLSDIKLMNKSEPVPAIRLTLRSFKFSRKPARLLLSPHPSDAHCPVVALLKFLELRSSAAGPIFVHKNNGRNINRAFVAKHLSRLLALAGRDPKDFNTHSLRVGRATDLALAGQPDSIIRQTGRWQSAAYLNYLRFSLFQLP